DYEYRLGEPLLTDLLQRGECRETGASIWRRLFGCHGPDVDQVAWMRDEDVVGITPMTENAKITGGRAELFRIRAADRALAASDPRIDQAHVAGFDVCTLRAEGDHLPDGFMTHRVGQYLAAVRHFQHLAAAHV